jgi:hypothetical protein
LSQVKYTVTVNSALADHPNKSIVMMTMTMTMRMMMTMTIQCEYGDGTHQRSPPCHHHTIHSSSSTDG